MKKLVTTFITLFSCGAMYALPIGNPIEASLFADSCRNDCNYSCYDNYFDDCWGWIDSLSFRIGYYGDFVFNRNLKVDGTGINQGKTIRRTEITTNAGYLALNYCNLIDVFTTLGSSLFHIHQSEVTFVADGNADGLLETRDHFSWSIGARATLFDWECFSLGVEGQYFRTRPEFSRYISYNDGRFNYFDGEKGTYHEWQVGTGISYTVMTPCPRVALVPYIGAKYSRARFDTHGLQFIKNNSADLFVIPNFKTKKHWGYAIGATITVCERAGITVEGRWGDERAIYVNGQIRI